MNVEKRFFVNEEKGITVCKKSYPYDVVWSDMRHLPAKIKRATYNVAEVVEDD